MINGILIINKPKNYTSHDIVAIIKKITGEKVGHTGTLDPNATGVLPLLIGKATQISKYLINHDKTYITTIKLGIKIDTADEEGQIIETQEVPKLSREEINRVLKKMVGKQMQTPPIHSAIKVNGKKLYEYARRGEKVEVKARQIEIYQLELLELRQKEAEIVVKVECSKGTYIRTLCEDIAENLHTVGYMKELQRIKVGEFSIEQAISIDELENKKNLLQENLISLEDFFNQKPKIELQDKEYTPFLNGVKLKKVNLADGLYKIYYRHQFIGTGEMQNGQLKRDIIL